MIQVSSELGDALRGRDITAISFITLFLKDIDGNDDTLRVTEAPRDITIAGQTFTSDGNIAALSAPDTQNAIDRDNYSIVFVEDEISLSSTTNPSIRTRFEQSGIHGVQVIVQLGLLDENDDLISELLNVYQGQSSGMAFIPQEGGYRLEVGFTGQLTQLDSTRTLLTTEESQHQLNPNDTSMRHVQDGVNDDALRWGRKN